jgi:hypothetical protein
VPPQGSCLAEASVPEIILALEAEELAPDGRCKTALSSVIEFSAFNGISFSSRIMLRPSEEYEHLRYVVFRFAQRAIHEPVWLGHNITAKPT